MSLKDVTGLNERASWEVGGAGKEAPKRTVYEALLELQGVKRALVAGKNASGGAQNLTVTGVTTSDTIIEVFRLHGNAKATPDLTQISKETTANFTITATDTVRQNNGTDCSNDSFLIFWADKSGA